MVSARPATGVVYSGVVERTEVSALLYRGMAKSQGILIQQKIYCRLFIGDSKRIRQCSKRRRRCAANLIFKGNTTRGN